MKVDRVRSSHAARLAGMALASLALLVPAVAFAQGSDTGEFAAQASRGTLGALGAAFVAGVGGSLTPCVWPMIPITVSIFGATEATSRARGAALSATFVLGIACLFVPLGIAAALGGVLMGAALAKPAVVIGIAALFVALAASMFGAFEMDLPPALKNRLSSVGGVGFKGAFVLGLVMGLVAAPCTGPFMTGLIAWLATTKDVTLGAVAMFLFALGLGVPFFVAGTFAVNLPKGGAWMMGIKWGSGVVLAYMALKYLRDRWPGTFRDVLPAGSATLYSGIAVFAIGLALGVVHVMAERRRSPIARWSKPAKLLSIVPAIGGLYVAMSWLDMPKLAEAGELTHGTALAPPMVWLRSEEEAMTQAKAGNKPVVVDFGASWCTACKELEHKTWPAPAVREQATRFVAVNIDMTDDEEPTAVALKNKYAVKGLPTVVLLDSQGQEKARFTEFVSPERMAEAMRDVQ